MNKLVIVAPLGTNLYSIPDGLTAAQVAASIGVTDPALYQEFPDTDFDPASYNFPSAFTLAEGVVGFNLATAKVTASNQAKSETLTQQQAAVAGYTPEVLAAQATLPELSRTPEIQASIVAVNDLNTALQANLTAIAAATTIDEVNNIVSPPTGLLFTGRGSGLGPQDLNVSYYTEFNSASMTEAETELYVPGTSTVISYGSGGPGQFDSTGNCFALGDYTIQIRETSTSQVIAEFECPLAPAGVDVAF
jgi:hypothetical protein